MITLFKQGYKPILEIFYKNKELKFHLRELARLTNYHGPSITRFLNFLELDNILSSKKEGNLKKYYINKNKYSFFIFEYFDILNFKKLPLIRQNAINIYIRNLSEKPIFIILFGSCAKENYKDSSDIDLLLITNNKINLENAKKEAEALTGITINSFQIKYKPFIKELKLKEDKVIQSALISGYPIYNNISFYEEIYNERI
jgi:predicted nucleotidyltransferase